MQANLSNLKLITLWSSEVNLLRHMLTLASLNTCTKSCLYITPQLIMDLSLDWAMPFKILSNHLTLSMVMEKNTKLPEWLPITPLKMPGMLWNIINLNLMMMMTGNLNIHMMKRFQLVMMPLSLNGKVTVRIEAVKDSA